MFYLKMWTLVKFPSKMQSNLIGSTNLDSNFLVRSTEGNVVVGIISF